MKSIHVHFLYIAIQLIHCMPIDFWQMVCSISRPNNNGQDYLSGSVRYINLVRCDRAFNMSVHITQKLRHSRQLAMLLALPSSG